MSTFVLFYPRFALPLQKDKQIYAETGFASKNHVLYLTNNHIPMKYLEFTFRTVPCTEIVNDVLSGSLGRSRL